MPQIKKKKKTVWFDCAVDFEKKKASLNYDKYIYLFSLTFTNKQSF